MITSSLCTGQLNYKRILGILTHSFVSPKLCEACSLGSFTFFPTGCCKMGAKFQSILLPLSFEEPLDLILLSLCSALKLLCSFQMNFFWLVLMYVQAGFKADTLESVTLTNCTLQIKPAFFFFFSVCTKNTQTAVASGNVLMSSCISSVFSGSNVLCIWDKTLNLRLSVMSL